MQDFQCEMKVFVVPLVVSTKSTQSMVTEEKYTNISLYKLSENKKFLFKVK